MTVHLRPVGPLPESVYWRRRAAVLGGPLVALLLLAQCGGSGDARLEQAAPAGAAPSAEASAPAAPSPSAPPASPDPVAAPAPCADTSLRVSATPQRPTYAVGARPVLRLAVRNGGPAPCVRPLGQGSVELTVFSGRDRIWSSDDCAPGGEPGPVVLRSQELRVITVTWSARRSRPGCPAGAEAIEPGTYRVVGRVGGLTTTGTGTFRVVG